MSILRRAMMYVGLVDEEYEEYDAYDEPAPSPSVRPRPMAPEAVEPAPVLGNVRPMPREPEPPSGVTLTTRPSVVRPIQSTAARVHVVEPTGFNDAQEIGDRLKNGQPVIVVLRAVDPDLSRRLIDFCSGATYVLDASMKRVDKKVYLLTPANVEVPAEERRRLQERGYLAPS